MKHTIKEILSGMFLVAIDDMVDSDHLDDYGVDSIDYTNAVLEIEDKFEIYFTNSEVEEMRFYRLGQLISFIEEKVKEKYD